MANMWMEADKYQIKGVPVEGCNKEMLNFEERQFWRDRVKLNQLSNLLHDALIATENVDRCAIIERRDGEQKAGSPGFTLTAEQIAAFADYFKRCATIRKEGLFFDDKNYKCVRADKNSIYAKSLKPDEGGLVVVRTNTMLVIATYSSKMLASVCIEAIEKLADYFREKGR